MSETTTARVEVLRAEVRTMFVGNRQITLSVAKQLDRVPLKEVEIWGRIKLPIYGEGIVLIGRHRTTGALVTTVVTEYGELAHYYPDGKLVAPQQYPEGTTQSMQAYPLIVLAGLK